MWRVAKDPYDESPIYFRECSSHSGHNTLLVISENPFKLQLFPNTFFDDLFRNNHIESHTATITEQEALTVKEEDLASFDQETLDFRKLRSILNEVIIDTDIDTVIDLVVNLSKKHS